MKRILIGLCLTGLMYSDLIDAMSTMVTAQQIQQPIARPVNVQPLAPESFLLGSTQNRHAYASIPTSDPISAQLRPSRHDCFSQIKTSCENAATVAKSCCTGIVSCCDTARAALVPTDCNSPYYILGTPSRCWNNCTASQQGDAVGCMITTCCFVVCCANGCN